MNKSHTKLVSNLIIISHKHGAEQKKSWDKAIIRLLVDNHFQEINELLLKKWIQKITNEKVKFVEISILSTDF